MKLFEEYFLAYEETPAAAKTKKAKKNRANERDLLGEGNLAPLPSSAITMKNTTIQEIDGVARSVVMQDRIESTRSVGDHASTRSRNPSNHQTSVNLLKLLGQVAEGQSVHSGRTRKMISLPPSNMGHESQESRAPSLVPPSPSVGNHPTNSASEYRNVLTSLIANATATSGLFGQANANAAAPVAAAAAAPVAAARSPTTNAEESKYDAIMANFKRLDEAKKLPPSESKDKFVAMLQKRIDDLMGNKGK